MKVAFKVKVAPNYKVAYMIHIGPYTGQNMWRSELNQISRWAERKRLRTGKWIMYFLDKWNPKTEKNRRSVAAIQIKGEANPEGKIGIMIIPKQKVVSVTFDPDKISDEIIYHGLESWLESKPYNQAARSRELYNGSPWTNRHAWANCEVQVPIRRK